MYLEASSGGTGLDPGLLQLVTTLGNITALAIENARYLEQLDGENRHLHEEMSIHHSMIGESKAMREVYEFVHGLLAAIPPFSSRERAERAKN